MSKLFDFLKYTNEQGLPVPLAKDSAKPGMPPSVTLFFLYLTNSLAIISLIYLHVKADSFVATATTCVYSITWSILYLMRNLHKAKIDLDDKSVELESEDEDDQDKNTN